jgi:microcystin degradation protein MlrC
MRIAVGCMMHESNTFASPQTRLADFGPLWGDDIYSKCDGTRHPFGGIVDTLKDRGATLVPTFYGRAMISGTVEREAYETMKRAILDAIRHAGPLDGICLALHGSMFADGTDDPEGDLLASIRELTGPAVPIVCSLDMHAALTERMASAANAFAAYRTAPHVDTYETGVRAAELLLKVLEGGLDVVTESIRMPMLLCGEQSESDTAPMNELLRLIQETEREHSFVLNADYLLGFPWAETPHHGVSVIVAGERQYLGKLRETAERLADAFWSSRSEFRYSTPAYALDECLDIAVRHERRPVLISDTGDNPTAGAAENVTLVLERLLERGITDALVAVIADPRAWEACEAAGEGETLRLELGKRGPQPDAPPLRTDAHVRTVHIVSGIGAAVVGIGPVDVVITDRRTAVYDPNFIRQLGLRLEDYQVAVLKTGYMSQEYQRLAALKLFALTPGDTNIDMTAIPYARLPRPIYPIDPLMSWEAGKTRH